MSISVTVNDKLINQLKESGIVHHDALFGSLGTHVYKNALLSAAISKVWDGIVVPSETDDRHILAVLLVVVSPDSMVGAGSRLFSMGFGPNNNVFDKTVEETTAKVWKYKKDHLKFTKKKNIIYTPFLDIITKMWEEIGQASMGVNQDISDETSDILANIYQGRKMVVVLLQESVDGVSFHFRGISEVTKDDVIPQAEESKE